MKENDNFGLIFVGGSPRSGTTLLQRILNSHPEIYGGPEFDFIPSIVDLRNRFLLSIQSGRIDNWLSKNEADSAFQAFVYGLFSFKREKECVKFISEKTPSNSIVFPELVEIFPEAKFVFCIRDPRAIASSMLRVGEKARRNGSITTFFTRDVVSAVDYINKCWESVFRASPKSKNVKIVYYEDIISGNDLVCKEICSFIGIDYDPQMMDIERSNFEYANPETYKNWYSVEKITSKIKKNKNDKWKKELTSEQIFYINNNIFKNNFITDRYQFKDPSISKIAYFKFLTVKIFRNMKLKVIGQLVLFGKRMFKYTI